MEDSERFLQTPAGKKLYTGEEAHGTCNHLGLFACNWTCSDYLWMIGPATTNCLHPGPVVNKAMLPNHNGALALVNAKL